MLELPSIAAAALATVWFDRYLWVTAAVIAFWVIARLVLERRITKRTQVDGAIGIMAIMAAVTLWISIDRSITLQHVYRLVACFGLFYAITNWVTTPSRIWLSLGVVAFSCIALASFAPISVEWATSKIPVIPSAIYDRFALLVENTVHRNVFAGVIMLPLAVVFAGILFSWREMRVSVRVLYIAAAGMGTFMFILAQSRGAVIGLGVVLLMLSALRFRYGWLLVPAALAAAAGVVYHWGVATVLEFLSAGVSLEGLEGRLEIWARAIFMVQDFPITGIGMGLYGPIADLLYPFFLAPPGSVPHAHNLFLQIAVDLGMPGLIAWLAILILVLRECVKLFIYGRRNGSGLAMALGAGLLGSQVALAVHGIFDAVAWGMVRVAPIVWALWGLAFAAGNVLMRGVVNSDSREWTTIETKD